MKKSGKLTSIVLISNIAINFLPTVQISFGIVALLKRIMLESRFLPSSQISGVMYNTIVSIEFYDVKSVSQPDTMPLFVNNY
jgi:hypothetical protein